MPVIADLHMHSTFSDGKYEFEKLIQKCIDANLSYFSISDHDTLNHIQSIYNFITQNNLNINFIPSTEITCNFNQSTIHILGYGVEENSISLSNIFSKMKQERINVIERMGKKMNELGCEIEYDYILEEQNSPGRPHLAHELVKNGYVKDIDEAFDKWLGKGKKGYIEKWKPNANDVVDSIHNSGGIAVIAHMGLYKSIDNLNEILELNTDGLEVYHPEHSGKYCQQLKDFCDSNDLIFTGGSDFHGWKDRGEFIGSDGLDENSFEQFYNKLLN